jgi:hypothetical protein
MRPRTHGQDYAYGIEHMENFPRQYQRIEHRFKLADIDWTEFCGYCHKPLMLVEMRKDTEAGLDINDKSSTVTGHLARGAGIPAYALGVYVDRPREVQAEIDQLNKRVLELTRQWPITKFQAQLRTPHRGSVERLEPAEWWEIVALTHSEHHVDCRKALASGEKLAAAAWRQRMAREHSNLYVPVQPMLLQAGG